MDNETVSIAGNEFVLLYSDLLPRLNEEQYNTLKEDISINGIHLPVITDDNRCVIDGSHRMRIAAELNLKDVPINILHHLDDTRKKELAIKLNTQRRQMTKKERLELAVSLRQDGFSLRQIASVLNVSHQSVMRYISTGPNGPVEIPDKIIGIDGKERDSKQKIKQPCTITKNIAEANTVFEACKGLSIEDLPNTKIDSKRLTFLSRLANINRQRLSEYKDYDDGEVELICGDFRENAAQIEDNSIDLIFTDPPYDRDALVLWEALADLASKKLKPGGLLVSYSGSIYLPQVFEILGKKLTYVWTAAIYHKGAKNIVPKVNAKACWKPILIYCKDPFNKYWIPFFDMYSGGQEKEHHQWEQSVDEAMYYIDKFCPKEGTLLDPMMGSGTSIIASLQIKTGIKTIGMDIDKAAYATALQRVEEYRKITT
jgi:16S rRNA G966 N2-methylase RsmD